ncbi:MAG TPA: tyrosine-type recombinase/integrase [Dermatophilaceae bacterium]|nr:tyrosine-type recombinase/integrase [Dermatophilaceae bacterium]
MTSKRVRHNGEGSIYRRGNGYAAYVWVTAPSGRRSRKYLYGQDREELHARWLELSRKAARGPVTGRVPTVEQYLDRWLNELVRPNLAPLTAATYESHVRNYITPGLGAIRLDRLRVHQVQSWLNRIGTQCQCCAQRKDAARAVPRCCALGRCCHQVPSARTVKDVRGVLRSALSYAVSEELVDRNVAALARSPKQTHRSVEAWTSEEARLFLDSARRDGDAWYAAYLLVLVMGLRKGEVLGLGWDAVDLAAGELTVTRQLQRVRRTLLLRETKTPSSDASLPIPALVSHALRERGIRQGEDRLAAGEAWHQAPTWPELVFTGRYGTPVDPRTFNRNFARGCAASGVRSLTVHAARRTCASLLVDLEVHPRVIMRILRHADLAVTMEVYARASSGATRTALGRLGSSLE